MRLQNKLAIVTGAASGFGAGIARRFAEEGAKVIVNAPTGLFPASETGDAFIQDAVSLPSPCIAPIVFVASPGGSWFAASGL